MATVDTLLTAAQFLELPDNGMAQELVRGKVVEMPPPGFRHGKVCAKVARLLGNHIEQNDLGHLLTNDTGTITQRDPDTVRGPDVSVYLYDRIAKNAEIVGYPDASPNLVVEVLSPDDRWSRMQVKIGEYLEAGVDVVLVADPDAQTVTLFRQDKAPTTFESDHELSIPEIFGDHVLSVSAFFR